TARGCDPSASKPTRRVVTPPLTPVSHKEQSTAMPSPSTASRWWTRIGIESRERKLVLHAGVCLALLGWADVSVQNVSETFFLKRVGVKYLPLAFLISSVLLVVTTYAIGRFAVGR